MDWIALCVNHSVVHESSLLTGLHIRKRSGIFGRVAFFSQSNTAFTHAGLTTR